MTRRTRTIVIGLGAAAAIVLAGIVAWRTVLAEEAEPVTVDAAVTRFRAAAREEGTPIPTGVYVYSTAGEESISALGGRRHRYPARSTVTVTRAGCGMTLRWDVLRTRHNAWDVCPEGASLRLAAWEEAHNFVGRDDVTRWHCAGTAWLPADRAPGSRSPYRCDGGATVQRGTITVVGEEAVIVGGVTVNAVRLRLAVTETGEARGPLAEERWLEEKSGLPLRIRYGVTTENDSPIGDVMFAERYDLRLTSLQPRR